MSAETVLIGVIVALTILLVLVGIQVVMIIKDMRRALKRLNSLLDDSILGGGLIRPDKLTGIFEFLGKRKNMTQHGGDAQTPETN